MIQNLKEKKSLQCAYLLATSSSWYENISIIFFIGPRCDKALGMKNGGIRSYQITASSSLNRNHGPNNARLHWQKSRARVGAWTTLYNNYYQWLQVNFKVPTRVIKISTQGRSDARQWVTKYYVEFSSDGYDYAEYKEGSSRKVNGQNQFQTSWTYPH